MQGLWIDGTDYGKGMDALLFQPWPWGCSDETLSLSHMLMDGPDYGMSLDPLQWWNWRWFTTTDGRSRSRFGVSWWNHHGKASGSPRKIWVGRWKDPGWTVQILYFNPRTLMQFSLSQWMKDSDFSLTFVPMLFQSESLDGYGLCNGKLQYALPPPIDGDGFGLAGWKWSK